MLIWADTVFVMENKHAQLIKQNTSNNYRNKIIVLEIEDFYKYYQKELIAILCIKINHLFLKIKSLTAFTRVTKKIFCQTGSFKLSLNVKKIKR